MVELELWKTFNFDLELLKNKNECGPHKIEIRFNCNSDVVPPFHWYSSLHHYIALYHFGREKQTGHFWLSQSLTNRNPSAPYKASQDEKHLAMAAHFAEHTSERTTHSHEQFYHDTSEEMRSVAYCETNGDSNQSLWTHSSAFLWTLLGSSFFIA